MGRKKPTACDGSGGAGKSKKMGFVIYDDEYSLGIEENVVPMGEENVVPMGEEYVVPMGKERRRGFKNVVVLNDKYEERDNAIAYMEDIFAVKFSGKKKSSKKKSVNDDTGTGIGDAPSDIVELDQHGGDSKDEKPNNEDIASKNKKKKNRGGKILQEEEQDLDKILSVSKPVQDSTAAPLEEKLQNQPAEQEGAEEVETVTLKKKKKKKNKDKDKEKEKKASATLAVEEEPKNEVNSKVIGKKVSKHVREIQERLAKLKEAEERKKREEEDKLRKEEEERLKQEELERLAQDKNRLKKEKLLKKKQQGKLLTGKQKEEAKRLEAMRKQILANAKLDLPTPAKRHLYHKKRPKPQNQSNGAAISENGETINAKEIQLDVVSELASVEAENVKEVESPNIQVETEVTDVVEDNGADGEKEEEDDDEEWDAKSWDEADLKLPGKSGFADEQVDSEPESVCLDEKATSPKLENVDVQKNSVAEKDKKEAADVQNGQSLRSPICCIMGHVNAGKTKLLDCIRGTHIQESEAGGITQQIGATYFPAENIRERTKELKADAKLNVPGLLVIDTPGHECFNKLRSRGSGLCDLAVLVVDMMHGLEPQTIESLNLLKRGNTDFVIALNKVDRLYGWKTCPNAPIGKAIRKQSKDVMTEFNIRLSQIITEFKEQGVNAELYYKNKEMGETYNIVPTSATSGEGIPDLLLLLVQRAQKTMVKRLTYREKVQCTVLDVKVVEGHGTTIDVVLVNGVLHEGDKIVVGSMQGAIETSIRALLTPHTIGEIRVKGKYLHHKEIKAAQCIKIAAQRLEHASAGAGLYVVGPNDDIESIKQSAMEYVNSLRRRISKSGKGVYLQASTLGSLEALLDFLETPAVNIPVSAISIGPVHMKDVKKVIAMRDKNKEYETILAFDVKVTPMARQHADEHGVKIFTADIIYHLFDQFKAYIDNLKEEKKREAAEEAVFPCVLKIARDCVINKTYPIFLGVHVVDGIIKIGTPICFPKREFVEIGRVASIENNHKPLDCAKKGQEVSIKIIGSIPEKQQRMFGRHFKMEDELVSKTSRKSVEALRENYLDQLSDEDNTLLTNLEKLFEKILPFSL